MAGKKIFWMGQSLEHDFFNDDKDAYEKFLTYTSVLASAAVGQLEAPVNVLGGLYVSASGTKSSTTPRSSPPTIGANGKKFDRRYGWSYREPGIRTSGLQNEEAASRIWTVSTHIYYRYCDATIT